MTMKDGRESTHLDPMDPRIAATVRGYWQSLLRVFPEGPQTPKDYVTVLAVLQDARLTRGDIEDLASALVPRPRELIARDIDSLGTVLVVPESDKASLRRKLGIDALTRG
jgi:hypothetical protein